MILAGLQLAPELQLVLMEYVKICEDGGTG
jgi:hypothetical protein